MEGWYNNDLFFHLLVFVHYSDIVDDIRILVPTSKVTFDCIFDDNGPVAKNIHKEIPKRKKVKKLVC